MTLSSIKTTLYTWASGAADPVKVIWADQGEHRPPKPYASIDLGPPSKIGGADEIRPQNDGTLRVVGIRQATVSVNTFGPNAFEIMTAFQSSLETPAVQETMRIGGVTFVDSSVIRDLSVPLESRFEQRAQMDITVRVVAIVSDTSTGYIEKTELTDQMGSEIIEP